jgi:DNA-binding response OmpR family regulator
MSKSILIVEDELVAAKDIRLTLERAGYVVVGIARSYHSAMDMISLNPPSLRVLSSNLSGKRTCW